MVSPLLKWVCVLKYLMKFKDIKGVIVMKRNFFKNAAMALMALGLMAGQAVTAFADGDVVLDCTSAIESEDWSQSVKFGYSSDKPDDPQFFDATRMTESSVITVSYEIIEQKEGGTAYPVELIFQSWSYPDTPMAAADGGVWAKVAPAEIGENTESFNYADIVAAYGTDNFEKVDCVLFGSTDSAKMKVTGVTVTNCTDEGHHWIDPSILEAEENRAKEQAEAKKKNIIFIIVGIVAGIAVAVGVIWLIISKKSSEAFDVSTGEFVDKKDAK